MFKRIVAIAAIFVLTSMAWMALGGVIEVRTRSTYRDLAGRVSELWGAPHVQEAPRAAYRVEAVFEEDAKEPKSKVIEVDVPLESSDIKVDLKLEQRRKGLLWYNTYNVAFDGIYMLKNTTGQPREFTVLFNFPTTEAIYDDFVFEINGQAPTTLSTAYSDVSAQVFIPDGGVAFLRVAYKSRGMDRWTYSFGQGVPQVKNFQLVMNTNFDAIDFPPKSISPGIVEKTPEGYRLTWKHENLISGFQVGMVMPEKLNPGPLASQISFFAPVSLLFFFFVIFVLSVIKGLRIHPMNYFFLAAAFFAFHLLFAYLVDHIDIHVAFIISSAVSIGLVVSYLRLVVGTRFALIEAGLSQFIYLVLFSYAHFFRGLTGLTVTIGAILTLFVMMQLTGRIDWEKKFQAR